MPNMLANSPIYYGNALSGGTMSGSLTIGMPAQSNLLRPSQSAPAGEADRLHTSQVSEVAIPGALDENRLAAIRSFIDAALTPQFRARVSLLAKCDPSLHSMHNFANSGYEEIPHVPGIVIRFYALHLRHPEEAISSTRPIVTGPGINPATTILSQATTGSGPGPLVATEITDDPASRHRAPIRDLYEQLAATHGLKCMTLADYEEHQMGLVRQEKEMWARRREEERQRSMMSSAHYQSGARAGSNMLAAMDFTTTEQARARSLMQSYTNALAKTIAAGALSGDPYGDHYGDAAGYRNSLGMSMSASDSASPMSAQSSSTSNITSSQGAPVSSSGSRDGGGGGLDGGDEGLRENIMSTLRRVLGGGSS